MASNTFDVNLEVFLKIIIIIIIIHASDLGVDRRPPVVRLPLRFQ